MTPQSGETLAHYRLLSKLGEGGMGVVWRAIDTRLDREIAIKFLPPAARTDAAALARFDNEAKALASLNHPGIVVVHSVERWGDSHFFTMELVRGATLTGLIPGGGMSLGAMLPIASRVAEAVAAAHERGIVHGDLKPANIMVGEDGRVKVLDFGLARWRPPAGVPGPRSAATEASTTPLDPSGGISGTLPYMSPEQILCEPVDGRSDIFSLGIVLHEMATGRRPFEGRNPAELVAAILKEEPPPIDEVNPVHPRELARLVRRCLAKDPRHRIQSARDLLNELEEIGRDAARGSRGGEPPSVAVLPFADMSQTKDQDYFCEGIAEEIINALTRISGLRVASRTSAFQFRNASIESREIGRRLGVKTLLEGSVRKSGDRLRITVELTDVARGFNLWAESYDRGIDDIFAIQEEIARSIAGALEVTLSPGETTALGLQPTRHVEAYDYYLRGRKFYYQYRRRGIEFALRMFTQAIEIDSGYAPAYAGIADCRSYLYLNAERRDEHRLRAEEASLKAIELAPGSAQAHASRGLALALGARHEEAERELEEAVRLDPRLFEAHYFYARVCFAQGKLEQAVRQYEAAAAARPEDYQALLLVAQIQDDLGRKEAARAARSRGLRIVEERLRLDPDDARAIYMGANALVALGETSRGLEWAFRALDMEPEEPMLLYNVGCVLSLAGRVEEAIDCLEKAHRNGLTQRAWYEHDSNLDPLRPHPRFQELMRRLPAAA